jgi:very-short-patch-repair endonuclease
MCIGKRKSPLSRRERVRERGADSLLPLAKGMRKQMSDAERSLWHHLRAHRMLGYKFRRQVVIEPYIVDFVCLEAMLIIEADMGGSIRHSNRTMSSALGIWKVWDIECCLLES